MNIKNIICYITTVNPLANYILLYQIHDGA